MASTNSTNSTATTSTATTSTATTSTATGLSRERADLLEVLRTHREFLRFTAEGLTDEQARQRSTVSELTIGGLIKHVADTEQGWAKFMAGQADDEPEIDWNDPDPALVEQYENSFKLGPDETLAEVLVEYERIAAATDELVATLPDLDTAYPLPEAPWHPSGATRSVRRTVMHIVAETAQHAGHADIIRESLDGQRTMG